MSELPVSTSAENKVSIKLTHGGSRYRGQTLPSTTIQRKVFLESLMETGNVLESCKRTGVTRMTMYQARADDPEFEAEWQLAIQIANENRKDMIQAELHKRAITGWLEPVFQNGKLVGKKRVKSDVCLIFYSKNEYPEKYGKDAFDPNDVKESKPLRIQLKWNITGPNGQQFGVEAQIKQEE